MLPANATSIHSPCQRVVSLLPSATEMLCLVGGSAQLIGRSHECDYPPKVVRAIPTLTAAKNEFLSSRQMHEVVAEELQSGTGLYTIDEAALRALEPQARRSVLGHGQVEVYGVIG